MGACMYTQISMNIHKCAPPHTKIGGKGKSMTIPSCQPTQISKACLLDNYTSNLGPCLPQQRVPSMGKIAMLYFLVISHNKPKLKQPLKT